MFWRRAYSLMLGFRADDFVVGCFAGVWRLVAMCMCSQIIVLLRGCGTGVAETVLQLAVEACFSLFVTGSFISWQTGKKVKTELAGVIKKKKKKKRCGVKLPVFVCSAQ